MAADIPAPLSMLRHPILGSLAAFEHCAASAALAYASAPFQDTRKCRGSHARAHTGSVAAAARLQAVAALDGSCCDSGVLLAARPAGRAPASLRLLPGRPIWGHRAASGAHWWVERELGGMVVLVAAAAAAALALDGAVSCRRCWLPSLLPHVHPCLRDPCHCLHGRTCVQDSHNCLHSCWHPLLGPRAGYRSSPASPALRWQWRLTMPASGPWPQLAAPQPAAAPG